MSFFSSFISSAHADTEEDKTAQATPPQEEEETPVSEQEKPDSEEEPEDEPEDVHPIIRDECKNSSKCAALAKHFDHCQEKVHAGQGFKGEDCVEELMMHCVDNCAAPKLFAQLK